MNCRNGERYLREAIDSIYAQTYPDWEIVFWDNNSIDNSAEIARSYDKRLKYFKGQQTKPLGAARNLALAHCRGEWVSFLDSDDYWLPQKLQLQMDHTKEHPEVNFVYGNFYRLFSDGRSSIGLKGAQPQGRAFEDFVFNYSINLQTVLIKKDVIDRARAAFDETLELAEEFDFFLRLFFDKQLCAGYINEPLSVTRIHKEMSSHKLFDRIARENEYVIGKFKTGRGLSKRCLKAIRFYEAKVDFYFFRECVKKGMIEEGRRKLIKDFTVDIRFFIIYLATFLPPILRPAVFRKLFKES